MKHRVTVGTDWDEILYRVQAIDFSCRQGDLVVDMNKTLADRPISILKVDSTYGTLNTMEI